jgi:hypothetical protein
MEEKRKRREAKEAKKRKEERANLRTEIEAQFIAKGETKPDIGAQEVLEVDGNGEAGKNVVGAIGGVLGQIILVLSIIEKNFNRQLTSKSTKSKKSSKSSKSGAKKESEKKAEDEAKQPTEEGKS